MSRKHRPYKAPKPRPVPDACDHCGDKLPPSKLYFYVDGNNAAITNNSPFLCIDCYRARYQHV